MLGENLGKQAAVGRPHRQSERGGDRGGDVAAPDHARIESAPDAGPGGQEEGVEGGMAGALAVCAAVVCVVAWGALVGSMLPLVLKRFGFDPATSSAPFVATLIDVTGIVIYFNIALMVMSGKLF